MSVRFGVVGTAYWAREVHVPGILRAQGGELVGIWGRTPKTARCIAEQYGIRVFARFEDLLAETDAVTMAVPPIVQAELGLRAAEAGKHMILEKPLAPTLATANAIAGAFAQRGTAGLVFFLRRFVPKIAAAIATECGHDWRNATIRVHTAALSSDTPYTQSAWRQQSGAVLWDTGPHVLSLLLPMLGPVEQVTAEPERGGICVFRTEHRSGACADVSMTMRADPAATEVTFRFSSPTRELLLPEPDIGRPVAFAAAVETLIAMIRDGLTAHECDVRNGATITAILAAVEQSAQERRPRKIDSLTGNNR